MNRFIFSALAALSIVLSSCGDKGPEPLKSELETYGKSHTYTLLGIQSDMGEDNDMSECDSVSLILPVRLNGVETSALRDTILVHALGETAETPFKAIDNWLEKTAAESGCETIPATVPFRLADGFQYVEGRIVNMNERVFTYCIATSTMLPGAANGLYTLDYLNYSMEAGRLITLADLFTPQGLKGLPSVISERAQQNPRYADSLNIDSLPEGGNFFLSSEGEIVFSYQPMEVGPHSLGNVQIAFYPEELVNYMTPSAVSQFGLQDIAQ